MGAAKGRRIVVGSTDVLVVQGYEIDASVLSAIVNPDTRILWAFICKPDDNIIQPVPYDECRVIWLTDDDLIRTE